MTCTDCGAALPAEARFCPACGAKQERVVWHLSGPGGQREGSLAEHVELVAAGPGPWHLWRSGWEGWRPWDEVPEAWEVAAPPTPPEPPVPDWPEGYRPPPVPDRLREPEETWHLHGAGEQVRGPLRELRERVADRPEVAWHLWTPGMEGWVPWDEVVG